MSNKSWWMFAAAFSLMPLAACEAPGAGEQGEEVQPAGGGVMGTETDPATGTDVEGSETDPSIEEGGGATGGGRM